MEVECYAKFHPERFHVTANTSSSQLYHFKSRILALVAAQVFSVVMVSRLFGISRKTFYTYRHQAEQGRLTAFDCTPHVHGSAKPQPIIDPVLHAHAQHPSLGKHR